MKGRIQAFTLVEMLIVIVIIGVLMAGLTRNMSGQITRVQYLNDMAVFVDSFRTPQQRLLSSDGYYNGTITREIDNITITRDHDDRNRVTTTTNFADGTNPFEDRYDLEQAKVFFNQSLVKDNKVELIMKPYDLKCYRSYTDENTNTPITEDIYILLYRNEEEKSCFIVNAKGGNSCTLTQEKEPANPTDSQCNNLGPTTP